MADRSNKTEQPTPKRRRDARRKGQIPRSPEVAAWGSMLLAISVVPMVIDLGRDRMEDLWREVQLGIARPSLEGAMAIAREGAWSAVVTAAPLVLTMLAISTVLTMGQVGFSAASVRLKPDLKRLNPVTGFKRLFSATTAFEAAKQVVKLVILTGMAVRALQASSERIAGAGALSIEAAMAILGSEIVKMVRGIVMLGLVIALVDYLFQRRRINGDMRMTKQEVKDEHRQSEGDPQMRGAIRSKQLTMTRNRMIGQVGGADVVVVNPTHFAVALKYDPERGAPRVVAKGAGHVAARIREEAESHGVPVVQDVPLARTLFRACDLGTEIPADLYDAVARLLAFIFALRAKGMARGFHAVSRSMLGSDALVPA
ncbi:MAG TPA: EscU/YscU/HrcU family type III secretion system export apparatus switch protein [Acidimicrobiia bacterium]|nr:EscU/YscU/HrcU family type III secretion system export apparatus switch protein [Acidimicrobiia bacterium]